MKNVKAMKQLEKIAEEYATTFHQESVVQFQVKLMRVALATTPAQAAKELGKLLADLAYSTDPEFVEFVETKKATNEYTTVNKVEALELQKVLPTAFGEKYYAAHVDGDNCINCGRNTSKQNANGVVIVDGGFGICKPEDASKEENDGGYMGWFPVGSECIKTVPAEYRAENPYRG